MDYQRYGFGGIILIGLFMIFTGGEEAPAPSPDNDDSHEVSPSPGPHREGDLLDLADDEYRQMFADAVELFANQKWTNEVADEWDKTIRDIRKKTHGKVSEKIVRHLIEGDAASQVVPQLRESRLFE